MKTIVESSSRDFILKHRWQTKKDAHGKIIWADEEKQIAKFKGGVDNVTFFEFVHNGENALATRVNLSVDEIKRLYAAIIEIENEEHEEFYD